MLQVGVVLSAGGQQSHGELQIVWASVVMASSSAEGREAWPHKGLGLENGQRAHDRSWLAVRMVPFFCLASRVVSGTLPISSTWGCHT
jgi:hypothetical protein